MVLEKMKVKVTLGIVNYAMTLIYTSFPDDITSSNRLVESGGNSGGNVSLSTESWSTS